jgi:hypothetical protein
LQTELWGAALHVFDYLSEERVVINSLNVGQSNAHKTEQVRMCSLSLPAIPCFLCSPVWPDATRSPLVCFQRSSRSLPLALPCSAPLCADSAQTATVQVALLSAEKQLLDLVNAILSQVHYLQRIQFIALPTVAHGDISPRPTPSG